MKLEPVRRPFRGSRVDKLSATQTRLAPRRRDGDSHGVHLAIRAWRGPVIVRWLVRRPRGRRSGSLVFPAPSLTLSVARRVFEVFRRCRAVTHRPERRKTTSGPSGLGSPSECSPVALVGLPTASPGIRPDRPTFARSPLAWRVDLADLAACAARRSSGVATPLHRHTFRASTPPCRHCCRPGSVPRQPASESCSALVVSHHLGGFLRSGGRGLVASRCQSWGSPRFLTSGSWSGPAPVRDRHPVGRSADAFPATLFTPLEEFHSTAAAPRHRGRCPLAVPSCPARPVRSAPLPESTL